MFDSEELDFYCEFEALLKPWGAACSLDSVCSSVKARQVNQLLKPSLVGKGAAPHNWGAQR